MIHIPTYFRRHIPQICLGLSARSLSIFSPPPPSQPVASPDSSGQSRHINRLAKGGLLIQLHHWRGKQGNGVLSLVTLYDGTIGTGRSRLTAVLILTAAGWA